jgi:hypothetical protein
MKQARGVECGVRRREAENACGRNVAGPWESSRAVDALDDIAKRDETLADTLEVSSQEDALSRALERRNSEEDDRHGRMTWIFFGFKRRSGGHSLSSVPEIGSSLDERGEPNEPRDARHSKASQSIEPQERHRRFIRVSGHHRRPVPTLALRKGPALVR